MDKYVIHSKSERGFWSDKVGWCYNINNATTFNKMEAIKFSFEGQWKPKILTKCDDPEWIVSEYGE